MAFIEIKTDRLILRPLGLKYLETTIQYAMDYENTKYMCRMPKETVDETKDFLIDIDAEWKKKTPDFYEFAIIFNDTHVGAVSIYVENDLGELGWIINKKYWKNRFAYEAATALIQYADTKLGVKHFIAHCDAENVASYKIMEKIGMVRTCECGERKNRSSENTSLEYQYELFME